MTQNIKLPRSIVIKNVTLLSSVNFVTKIFQAFTLYDNIKTLNMDFLSRQQNFEPVDIFNEVDDSIFDEELRSCQFLLEDSEIERAWHEK